jgi:hypothetical protein
MDSITNGLLSGDVIPSQLPRTQKNQVIAAALFKDPTYSPAQADMEFAANKAGAQSFEKNFNNLDSVKNMLNEGKAVCKSCGKAKCKCVDESKGSKPDFLDVDKDGNKKEPMKKAVADKKDKKEDKVDETTVSGSVATASPSGKSSSGGMQFGKGVYEGFNNQVESMITESIDVTETVTEHEGEGKTITVTASGPEADMLMQLLKAAGLSGQSSGCGCGQTPCACDQTVEEAYGDTDETLNDPDWPTDTETLAADPELRTYSGGLNGPKSTGQTTIPVVASQERRLHSESVELERSLFKTWKNYKG